jgi:CDP-diglyceride synthetase
LLSRTQKNATLISFLGMLSILMIFEFIAMLSHPYIEEWTHHNPILMLMILVAIASILVPLHHRLEHWIKKRSMTKHPTPKVVE